MFDRARIESLLPATESVAVAHYTTLGTLCHLVPHSSSAWTSAWATPVQFLNDRRELSLGLEILSEVAKRPPRSGVRVRTLLDSLLTTPGRLETDAFQMSFSGDPDELGQWPGYAANGMGCAVVTDAAAVKAAADVAGWVLYEPARQKALARKVLEDLRKEADVEVIERMLISTACYMKHSGFRPEMEFRLLKFPEAKDVRFRESGDRLVPYVDFLAGAKPLPISKIVVGPGWQLAGLKTSECARHHVVQGIHRLLAARDLHGVVSIEPSSIPYDPR